MYRSVLVIGLAAIMTTSALAQGRPSPSPSPSVMKHDAMKGGSMKHDAMHGSMKHDSMKASMKHDAMKGDAMAHPAPTTTP